MKLIPHHQDDKYGPAGTTGRAGRFTSVARAAPAAGVITLPSSAGGTRWSSWTPRPRHRRTRASRQRPPGGVSPTESLAGPAAAEGPAAAAERIERVMATTETELKIFGGTACRARAAPGAVREARRVPAAALGREAGEGRGQETRPPRGAAGLVHLRGAAGLVHLHGRPSVRGGDREGTLEAKRGGHGGGAGYALAVGGVAVRAGPPGGVRRVDRGRAEQSSTGAKAEQ